MSHLAQIFESDTSFLPSNFSLFILYVAVGAPLFAACMAGMLIFVAELQEPFETPTGCSKLGVPEGRSLLDDEHDAQFQHGSPDKTKWKVKSIFIYPIKSCRGIEMDRSMVTSTGLTYDRQFSFARLMVGDGEGEKASTTSSKEPWRFITQREFRLMSQVRVSLYVPDPKRPAYNANLRFVKTGGALLISFPWIEPGWKGRLAAWGAKAFGHEALKHFVVPFDPTPEQLKMHYSEDRFTIWKETVTATNMGVHVPPELRRFLGCSQPLTLMRVQNPRQVFRAAPRKEKHGWQPLVGFADAYPIHVLGLASVHEVNRRQPEGSPKLTARRFRPNIFLEGTPPFEEDEWKRLKIGKYSYHGDCRCVRCTIPNIEPDSAARHMSQPRKTLLATRDVDKGAPGEGCLGMNITPEKQEGVIGVGDFVEVLETGEQVYVKS